MYCPSCGTQVPDNYAVCPHCGNTVKKQAPQSAPNNYQNQQYAQPQQQYAQPQQQYAQPQQQYAQPQQQYAQPQQQYAQPQQQYAQPQGQYNYQQPGNANYNPAQNAYAQPKSVTFGEAIKLFFTNYANFNGRATISEYWWIILFNVIVGIVLGLIQIIPVVGIVGSILSVLYSLATFIPSLALSIRRLHDTGKSWVYILMGLIPLAGFIILIVQYCKASDGDNQWGPVYRG